MVTISLCMIVKDEEKVLKRCLNSVKAAVDEIVIVDTGSSDKTVTIAKTYTENVYCIPWKDDFSAARNVSFAGASMDYCMWLDADDVLLPAECGKLIRWKQNADKSSDVVMLKYVVSRNADGSPGMVFYRERLLKRERRFRWQGRVHEAIEISGKVEYAGIAVEHRSVKNGYSARNLNIYRRMEKEGEAFSVRDCFYYGRELFYHGKYTEALDKLTKFLLMPGGFVENRVEACRILASCCYALGRDGEALEFLYRGLTYRAPSGELCCDIGKHFFVRKRWEQAAFWYEAALRSEPRTEGGGFVETDCYGYLPCIQLSVCRYYMGQYEKAREYHEKAGRYRPSGKEYLANARWFEGTGGAGLKRDGPAGRRTFHEEGEPDGERRRSDGI